MVKAGLGFFFALKDHFPCLGKVLDNLAPGLTVFRLWHGNDRGRVLGVAVHGPLGRVVEKRRQRIKLFGADRVKLVIVAHRATRGQAQKYLRRRFCSIPRIKNKVFFGNGSAFAGGDVATIKTGGDLLVQSRLRQEVPGELLQGELVKGHILIHCPHNPLSIAPHFAKIVKVNSMAIGIPGGVQPIPTPMFPPLRLGQKLIDKPFIGIGGGVRDKRFHHQHIGGNAV